MRTFHLLPIFMALFLALAANVHADNKCEYNTNFGTVNISVDFTSNTVTGWTSGGAEINAMLHPDDTIRGTYYGSTQGNFIWYLSEEGFSGYWAGTGSPNWEGEWYGTIVQCWD